MKKRFLPISLLLTIIILAQTSFVVNANGDSGKYTPRSAEQVTAQSFMRSIRANQETGLIDPAWLVSTDNSQLRAGELNWSSLGPDNYGSLTRGIVYDKNDTTNKTIYLGTMGGGIFQSTNGGITWKTISENLMVSSMAQTEDGTVYVGTGDGRSAHNQNGLSALNYETSFVGCGIYNLTSKEIVAGTENWAFVNDIATRGNSLYAATSEGLYQYENNTLTALIDTTAVYGVEVSPNGNILAVVGNDVCLFKNGSWEVLTNDGTDKLAKNTFYKIIAVSPTDNNYMYVSYLTKNNETGNIYVTSDQGETWQIAYKSTAMHNIHGTRGILDNAMVVYPNNPRKLLIGGTNLWVLRDEIGEGIYRLECISDGNGTQISQSGGTFFYNYKYVHLGIQAITFNPNNVNEFFVGTEGGVFKGTYSSNGYLYEGANRYFETADNHTSVARMFSVAFSGAHDYTLGGSLDHGTIHVYGQANLNNETKGISIFPNDIAITDAAATYGAFDFTKAAGPCAISTIDSNMMFITTTGQYSIGTPLFRTESAGADYDKENFTYSATENTAFVKNTNAFRTPIALFENYNDTKSIDTANVYHVTTDLTAGTEIEVRSKNATYPFNYTLTEDKKAGDSICALDRISATFIAAIEGKVIMTRDALKFSKKIDWLTIAKVTGIPNALTISADGDVAYVGTLKGKLYRISGISDAVAPKFASIDSTACVITTEEIDGTIFNERAITSIAIDPKDSNKVIVTLGNYGNDDYVFYATDGKTFESIQNENLPKVPVYSSLIEKNTGRVMLGTENGLYVSADENMTSWSKDNAVANVPVMEIKQQLLENHDKKYIYGLDDNGNLDMTNVLSEYPAISNNGVVYIATYGRGLYKCEDFVQNDGESIEDNESFANSLEMSIYPNPVVSEATISFNVEETTTVSYQIYDLSGRMVQNSTLGNYNQGSHKATFNVNGLANGTYIVKVQAGTKSNTSKILVY